MRKDENYYYACFTKVDEALFRLDTRIYLDETHEERSAEAGVCVASVVCINPGSARETELDKWTRLNKRRDLTPPTIRNRFVILQAAVFNKLGDVAASAHNHENHHGRSRRTVQNQEVSHRPKQDGTVSSQVLSLMPDAWIPCDTSKRRNEFNAHLPGDPVTRFFLVMAANAAQIPLGRCG